MNLRKMTENQKNIWEMANKILENTGEDNDIRAVYLADFYSTKVDIIKKYLSVLSFNKRIFHGEITNHVPLTRDDMFCFIDYKNESTKKWHKKQYAKVKRAKTKMRKKEELPSSEKVKDKKEEVKKSRVIPTLMERIIGLEVKMTKLEKLIGG